MGQESVLSSLRKTFWIVKGRAAVRRVIGRCMNCQRQRKAYPGEQFMASLAEDRLIPDKPPFTYVGIDYFGPLEVKQGRSRVKRYGCLFTCLATRAVHIEIAQSLDTDSMINALGRFISVRGYPEQIRSDQGSNFPKADKELKEAVEAWNEHKINNFCGQKRIEWIFNPPSASHMGGAWERMIRSVRQILKAILKEQLVSDEVLSTVMAEAVNILNSRPLTRISDSPLDEQPLTPNHLLHLRPRVGLPPGIFDKDDLSYRRAWRQAQYLANLLWRRWTSEYLPTLLERKKWNAPKRNLEVGDLVLLADKSFPRDNWPLRRIVEVMPSRDGLLRTVRVKTCCTVATRAKRQRKGEPLSKEGTTVLTSPVTKLCLLEMDWTALINQSVQMIYCDLKNQIELWEDDFEQLRTFRTAIWVIMNCVFALVINGSSCSCVCKRDCCLQSHLGARVATVCHIRFVTSGFVVSRDISPGYRTWDVFEGSEFFVFAVLTVLPNSSSTCLARAVLWNCTFYCTPFLVRWY